MEPLYRPAQTVLPPLPEAFEPETAQVQDRLSPQSPPPGMEESGFPGGSGRDRTDRAGLRTVLQGVPAAERKEIETGGAAAVFPQRGQIPLLHVKTSRVETPFSRQGTHRRGGLSLPRRPRH